MALDMISIVDKIILLTRIMILSVSVEFRNPNLIIQSSIENHNCLHVWRDWPVESEPLPQNCGLNILSNIDKEV